MICPNCKRPKCERAAWEAWQASVWNPRAPQATNPHEATCLVEIFHAIGATPRQIAGARDECDSLSERAAVPVSP